MSFAQPSTVQKKQISLGHWRTNTIRWNTSWKFETEKVETSVISERQYYHVSLYLCRRKIRFCIRPRLLTSCWRLLSYA